MTQPSSLCVSRPSLHRILCLGRLTIMEYITQASLLSAPAKSSQWETPQEIRGKGESTQAGSIP